MSANGARDTQNRFYYDGIEAMDLDSYSFSFSPSIDAINEFKVQSSTYSAEIGGAPGGQVNLTTKSGTNAFHGDLVYSYIGRTLTAMDFFTKRNLYSPAAAPVTEEKKKAAWPGGVTKRYRAAASGPHHRRSNTPTT